MLRKQHKVLDLLEKTGRPLVRLVNKVPCRQFRMAAQVVGRLVQRRRFVLSVDRGIWRICDESIFAAAFYSKFFLEPNPKENYLIAWTLDQERIYGTNLLRLVQNLCEQKAAVKFILTCRHARRLSRACVREIINGERVKDIRPYVQQALDTATPEDPINLTEEQINNFCQDYTNAYNKVVEEEERKERRLAEMLDMAAKAIAHLNEQEPATPGQQEHPGLGLIGLN
jgi:hypothetical protein